MDDKTQIPTKIGEKLLEYVLATPKALAVLVFSFLSGHLWMFVIVTYFKKSTKGNTYLNNKIGKTALGLAWVIIFLAPTHWLKFRSFNVEPDNILSITLGTVLVAAFVQAVIFILITVLKAEKK